MPPSPPRLPHLPYLIIAGSKPESGFLAAVTDARFHKRPVTGDEIKYSVEFEAAAMGLARFKGRAEIDGELAAEGTFTFSVPGRAAR